MERKSTKIDQEIERRLEEQQEKSGQGSTVALHAARDKVHDSAGPVLRPGAAYNSNQSASPVQASILDSYPNKFAARSGTRRNLDRDDGPLDGSFGADSSAAVRIRFKCSSSKAFLNRERWSSESWGCKRFRRSSRTAE